MTGSGQPPIIVRINEPPDDPTGLGQVILQALGLTGALTLLAVLLGAVFAAVLFWLRSRQRESESSVISRQSSVDNHRLR